MMVEVVKMKHWGACLPSIRSSSTFFSNRSIESWAASSACRASNYIPAGVPTTA